MRYGLKSIFAIFLLGPLAAAAPPSDAGKAQEAAALENALAELKSQVSSTPITSRLTIGDFVTQTKSADAFNDALKHAQIVGGPRWIDDHTCQIKLDLPGSRIAYELISIAATRDKLSPIPAGALEQRLRGLKSIDFVGTGTSLAAAQISELRPVNAGDAWNGISDQQRSAAIADARRDAEGHLLDDVKGLKVTTSTTVSSLLERPAVQKAVDTWLSSRPVSNVRFKDDLSVELMVDASQSDLVQTAISAARSDGVTIDDSADHVTVPLSNTQGSVGRSSIVAGASSAPAATIVLPDVPPIWTSQPIDAQGSAEKSTSPLRTKARAEAKATDALRAKIGRMMIDEQRTIDELSAADPRIDNAVGNALLRAQVYKVEMRADGSVAVKITLDGRDLWNEIRQSVLR